MEEREEREVPWVADVGRVEDTTPVGREVILRGGEITVTRN